MSPRRVIQGHDGPVEIDPASGTVTKTYPQLDRDIAVRKIEREVAHASRLLKAFAELDGVSCPRVLAWDLSPPPRIVMELCPGEPLSSFLGRTANQGRRGAEIAQKIHDGLAIYARVFDEPYHDLCFQNILYDEATGVVTFLDFGVPDRIDGQRQAAPLETSLGNFVGWACYDMARPSRLLLPGAGYMKVLRAVLAAFDGRISRERVRAAARATFMRLTISGTAVRRAYYKTAGLALTHLRLSRL